VTDATGAVTRFEYDARHRLIRVIEPDPDGTGPLSSPVTEAQNAVDLAGYTWTYDSAGRIAQFTSLLDGTVTYTHDATGQLTGADYATQDDESYTYDENGNRIGGGYVVGTNNQLLSDGTFWYDYDPEGNRTLRYVWTDADADGVVDQGERSSITEYAWDHRNRLASVIERDTDGGAATQIVEHTYDYLNRWVARAVDSDGDGPLGSVGTHFVYDGTPGAVSLDRAAVTTDQVGQIVLQFDDDAQAAVGCVERTIWAGADSAEGRTSCGSKMVRFTHPTALPGGPGPSWRRSAPSIAAGSSASARHVAALRMTPSRTALRPPGGMRPPRRMVVAFSLIGCPPSVESIRRGKSPRDLPRSMIPEAMGACRKKEPSVGRRRSVVGPRALGIGSSQDTMVSNRESLV